MSKHDSYLSSIDPIYVDPMTYFINTGKIKSNVLHQQGITLIIIIHYPKFLVTPSYNSS